MLSFLSATKPLVLVVAEINLKTRTVRLWGVEKVKCGHDYLDKILEPFPDPSGLAAKTLEQPLLTAIQAAGNSVDSRGFTFNEIRQLVQQAVLPGQEHLRMLDKLLKAPLLHDK